MSERIVVQDELKMLEKIQSFPRQLEKAWTSLWTKDLNLDVSGINKILLVGMGGSGIAGELARDLILDTSSRPLITWADYQLPAWVDKQTLVIASSYSGDTEETLDGIKIALERQIPLVAISSGGKLTQLATGQNFPLIPIDYQSQPRAALGALYGSLLTLLTKLKLVNLTEAKYFAALGELSRVTEEKSFHSKAEDLAITLSNKLPLVFAHQPLVGVARRWRTQFNENAKSLAVDGAVPEACHNLIVGLENPIPEKLSLLYLETNYGFSRNRARQAVLEKLVVGKTIPFTPLSIKAGNQLAEQWLFIYFGDLLSYYLAGVYGLDPTPIEMIRELKEELSKL